MFSDRFKVGFFEAYNTPRHVREHYLLYASCVDAYRAMKQAEANRAAQRGG